MTKSSDAAGIFVVLFLFLLSASLTHGIRAKRQTEHAEQTHELDLAGANSILIIGGKGSGGTVEKLTSLSDSETISSQIIQQHEELNDELNKTKHLRVRAAPVRKLRVDSAQKGLIMLLDGSRKSFYVNSAGEITNGPETTIFTPHIGLTSLPGAKGELRPIYCHGRLDSWGAISYFIDPWDQSRGEEPRCMILNNERNEFEHHSYIDARSYVNVVFTLTVLGDGSTLILLGGGGKMNKLGEWTSSSFSDEERPIFEQITLKYTKEEGWVAEQYSPSNLYGSSAVSTSNSQLLSCAGIESPTSCSIFDTDAKRWFHGPEMKASATFGQMLLMRHTGQTVIWSFAADSEGIMTVQTFDVSGGLIPTDTEWQLVPVEFQAKHSFFGVLSIDKQGTRGYIYIPFQAKITVKLCKAKPTVRLAVLASESVEIAYGENFSVEMYGDKAIKLIDFTSNTIQHHFTFHIKTQDVYSAMQRNSYRSEHNPSLSVKEMKIRRRNQFIEEMFFKCGEKNQQQYGYTTRFRCGMKQKGDNDDSAEPTEFTELEKIKEKYWSIESPKCNDGWCMRCDMPYDDESCPDVTESLDCSAEEFRCAVDNTFHNSSTHSCYSIPELMNPNCDREDCVGHSWKTSIIQMHSDPTCDFEDVHFKMRMKILEQNKDHNVTVSFYGAELPGGVSQEELFHIQVEFSKCGTDGCVIKLMFIMD